MAVSTVKLIPIIVLNFIERAQSPSYSKSNFKDNGRLELPVTILTDSKIGADPDNSHDSTTESLKKYPKGLLLRSTTISEMARWKPP